MLGRLTEVDGLERFLGFAFQGKKRFSIEGTDALLARCGELRREGAGRGVLVKLAKPGQDRRLDLPAVGPGTMAAAAAAGLAGVVVQAGSALLLDRAATVAAADAAGLFLWGRAA